MTGRPFAVFDIDGTLIRWQLYHAIFDSLAAHGYIKPEVHEQIRTARATWKQRVHEDSFDNYERAMVASYNQIISSITVTEFSTAVKDVFREYKDQVYTYTRDLIRELKANNYLLFAVSGSQAEIVQPLATYYKFDDCGASVFTQRAGQFTGESQTMRGEAKTALVRLLIKKHGATYKESIGVGDSEGDIPMLQLTEKAIAFNPTKHLFKEAVKQGWQIVLERKNVIYTLEVKDGSYILA